MPDRVRAAMRVAAFDGPQQREAMKRMDGAGQPAMWAAILWATATDPTLTLPEDDRRTLVLGAIEAQAAVPNGAPEWRARMDSLLRAGAAAGLSLREMGDAAGVSHTAVRKRLLVE